MLTDSNETSAPSDGTEYIYKQRKNELSHEFLKKLVITKIKYQNQVSCAIVNFEQWRIYVKDSLTWLHKFLIK